MMAVENSDGSYARVKIWDKELLMKIGRVNKERLRALGAGQGGKFLIAPRTYFNYRDMEGNGHYIFLFQLRLFFRQGFDTYFNFVVEQFIVRKTE